VDKIETFFVFYSVFTPLKKTFQELEKRMNCQCSVFPLERVWYRSVCRNCLTGRNNNTNTNANANTMWHVSFVQRYRKQLSYYLLFSLLVWIMAIINEKYNFVHLHNYSLVKFILNAFLTIYVIVAFIYVEALQQMSSGGNQYRTSFSE
jgi:hypothetical protein